MGRTDSALSWEAIIGYLITGFLGHIPRATYFMSYYGTYSIIKLNIELSNGTSMTMTIRLPYNYLYQSRKYSTPSIILVPATPE